MEEDTGASILATLADPDLVGLRLAAQVMAHKAELENRDRVASYFSRLQSATQAELASRLTGIRAVSEANELAVGTDADVSDRRLINEYLGLLVANENLSRSLREACRRLRSRNLA